MDIDTFAAIGTAVGLILTGFGLILAVLQMRNSRKVALGEFLLHLDEMFFQHQEVHIALRPGGKWANDNNHPNGAEEWAMVEDYMGLLEQVYILIDQGMIDADIIERIYKFRLINIVAHDTIRQAKLVKEKRNWADFIALCKLFGVDRDLQIEI